jgi:heptosyltransferase-1
VVLTLPAVHALRENFPPAKITYLTSRENAALLAGFRDVDHVIALDRRALRTGNPFKIIREFFRLLQQIRAGHFSLVVDLQGYGETAWLTRLTGATERWGTIYGSGRQWAYTRSLPRNSQIHATEGHLALLRHGGLKIENIRNEFSVPPDALAAAGKFFQQNQLNPAAPTLFIQGITSSPQKNWPLENYLAVARHWRGQGMQIIFGGGPADHPALQPALAEHFCVAAGVPLLVTAGLAQLSTFVLGGDTGVTHLAVAQGKPVLMLMQLAASGSPVPFQHADWVITPSTPDNLAGISVAEVNAAIQSRLPRAFQKIL